MEAPSIDNTRQTVDHALTPMPSSDHSQPVRSPSSSPHERRNRPESSFARQLHFATHRPIADEGRDEQQINVDEPEADGVLTQEPSSLTGASSSIESPSRFINFGTYSDPENGLPEATEEERPWETTGENDEIGVLRADSDVTLIRGTVLLTRHGSNHLSDPEHPHGRGDSHETDSTGHLGDIESGDGSGVSYSDTDIDVLRATRYPSHQRTCDEDMASESPVIDQRGLQDAVSDLEAGSKSRAAPTVEDYRPLPDRYPEETVRTPESRERSTILQSQMRYDPRAPRDFRGSESSLSPNIDSPPPSLQATMNPVPPLVRLPRPHPPSKSIDTGSTLMTATQQRANSVATPIRQPDSPTANLATTPAMTSSPTSPAHQNLISPEIPLNRINRVQPPFTWETSPNLTLTRSLNEVVEFPWARSLIGDIPEEPSTSTQPNAPTLSEILGTSLELIDEAVTPEGSETNTL